MTPTSSQGIILLASASWLPMWKLGVDSGRARGGDQGVGSERRMRLTRSERPSLVCNEENSVLMSYCARAHFSRLGAHYTHCGSARVQ